MTKYKKPTYIGGTGKRRSASARVRVFKGSGENLVNNIPVEKYFPGEINKAYWIKPFVLTNTLDKYYFSARIIGSGKKGQLDALVHGLARAFVKTDTEKFKSALKKAGLLTRDSRIRQRRMVGMGGKSRRKKQSPKR
jgi:small subunit ribosomal protein S9